MGCRMSLKVHILDAHLDKFKENMGAYSEEQGERFHQVYWTLNIVTKDSITKTWWGTTFGGLFEKAICSTLANLEKLFISEPFWVIFWTFLSESFCLLTMQVLFLSHRMNKNVKISLFCHKYEIFLGCVHKIKVCAECSRFSIGFEHKQLKYNTWKSGTNIALHSVIVGCT